MSNKHLRHAAKEITMSDRHNGWANHQTYRTSLWIFNTESILKRYVDVYKGFRSQGLIPLSTGQINKIFPPLLSTTLGSDDRRILNGDLPPNVLSEVDWPEIYHAIEHYVQESEDIANFTTKWVAEQINQTETAEEATTFQKVMNKVLGLK